MSVMQFALQSMGMPAAGQEGKKAPLSRLPTASIVAAAPAEGKKRIELFSPVRGRGRGRVGPSWKSRAPIRSC